MIVVTNLVKSYDGRRILEGVSFTAEKGQVTVIMGGSGGGKTTLLRCLIGAVKPDSGEIRVNGADIARMEGRELDEVRKKMGVLFQGGALFNSLTVGENVALPIREHTRLDDTIVHIMVKVKLELVGLRDFEHLKPGQISGGMQKRVALARAIALDPEIVFYDEPSAGLDPITSGVIDKLMVDLTRKLQITSVVVTHEMKSAFTIADKMLLLYKGTLIAQGTPGEIRSSSDPRVIQFINGEPDGPIPFSASSKEYRQALLEL